MGNRDCGRNRSIAPEPGVYCLVVVENLNSGMSRMPALTAGPTSDRETLMSKTRNARNRKKRPVRKLRLHKRVAPCGFSHTMLPLFVGMAAAEFLPADSAQWFKAATAAKMKFGITPTGNKFYFDPNAGDEDRRNFLIGWMHGTTGGFRALEKWMKGAGHVD